MPKSKSNPIKIIENDDHKLSTIPKFRGVEDLESNMEYYNRKLQESEELLKNACKEEIRELEQAQQKLQKKLNDVLKSDEMAKLEQKIDDSGQKVNSSMRKMYREIDKMHEEFEKDPDTYDKNMMALNRAVAKEYTNLANKYPAAMKAQMLSSITGVRMIM